VKKLSAKERVYELAKRLVKLKAEERTLLNQIEAVRKRISETEIEMYQAIEKSEEG